jgi:hypothetical protein
VPSRYSETVAGMPDPGPEPELLAAAAAERARIEVHFHRALLCSVDAAEAAAAGSPAAIPDSDHGFSESPPRIREPVLNGAAVLICTLPAPPW